jgi:hypothetical protein
VSVRRHDAMVRARCVRLGERHAKELA